MKPRKLLEKLQNGDYRNVRFDDFFALVEAFGFTQRRVRGSHHIFVHPDCSELLNLQRKQDEAKPYQIRQFLRIVEDYNLKYGEAEK